MKALESALRIARPKKRQEGDYSVNVAVVLFHANRKSKAYQKGKELAIADLALMLANNLSDRV